MISYTSAILKSIKSSAPNFNKVNAYLPKECCRRKRGSRGGAILRLRRQLRKMRPIHLVPSSSSLSSPSLPPPPPTLSPPLPATTTTSLLTSSSLPPSLLPPPPPLPLPQPSPPLPPVRRITSNRNPNNTPQHNIRILCINFRSIRNKICEFQECVDHHKPDIVLGSESWLTEDFKNAEIFPEEYQRNVFRKDRTGHGGGVFIAAHNKFDAWEVIDNESDSEIVWAEIKTKMKNIIVGAYYRPPNSDITDLDNLQTSLNKINSKNKIVILGGDFNLPHIDWSSLTVNTGTNQAGHHYRLLEIMEDLDFRQMQLSNTRENNNLDLYFTNHHTLVKSCDTAPGLSDHDIVVVDSNIKPHYNKIKPRKIFQYHKTDWTEIKIRMNELAQQVTNMNNTVEIRWNSLKSGITSIMNENIPYKMSSCKHSLPWITTNLKNRTNQKHKLYQKAKKSNKAEDWTIFKEHKSKLQREIRQAHWNYINNVLDKNLKEGSNKHFWKYVKAKRTDNIGIAALKENGTLHHESAKKAQILNAQFKSVFTKNNPNENPLDRPKQTYPSIDQLHITTKGVYKLLDKIDPKKASGPDGIPNMIIKTCASELAPAVTSIFRQSVTTGQVPLDWRNANITPIFKKGNKHVASNYRPVSLTSVCCKTLEHIICKHIVDHLEKHNILTHLQHGFRSGYSCETQLITTIHDLAKSYDLKQQIDLVILDFSKAFDTVPHRKLLHKLSNYGICGHIHTWITNFLIHREQRVIIDGIASSPCAVESGVPQGTVLGPLLFLCYINDLPKCVSSQVRLFADDSLLYRTINSPSDHNELQKDLHSLQSWANTWGMKFNATKCYLMSIHRSRKPSIFEYTLNNHILDKVQENPYLGITITDNLKWSSHINKITNRANSTLGFVKRNLKHSNPNFKETAYNSLVRSIMDYGDTVWDPYLQKDIDKLERVQRKAARFVKNDYSMKSSVSNMITELGWRSLADRRKEHRVTLTYKILNGGMTLPRNDLNLEYNTRRQRNSNSNSLKQLSCSSDAFKYSFAPRTIKDWNALPEECVSSTTVAEFKRNTRKTNGPPITTFVGQSILGQ